jgi:hypothetical protein
MKAQAKPLICEVWRWMSGIGNPDCPYLDVTAQGAFVRPKYAPTHPCRVEQGFYIVKYEHSLTVEVLSPHEFKQRFSVLGDRRPIFTRRTIKRRINFTLLKSTSR